MTSARRCWSSDPVLYDKVTASLDEKTGEILWWSTSALSAALLDLVLDDPAGFVPRTWRNLAAIASVLSPSHFPLFLFACP